MENKNYLTFKDYQLLEKGHSTIKWLRPNESSAIIVEGELEHKKISLIVDVVDKQSAKKEWKFTKEDVKILLSMYESKKSEENFIMLLDIEDAKTLYSRLDSIIKEAEDTKETNKEKAPAGDSGGGMGGGFGGGGGMGF